MKSAEIATYVLATEGAVAEFVRSENTIRLEPSPDLVREPTIPRPLQLLLPRHVGYTLVILRP